MRLFGRLAAWWDEFFFLPVDVPFVDAFRIAYAALLLVDCVGYLPFVNMWWGAEGAVPFDVARSLIDPDTLTIFTWLPRNDTFLWFASGFLPLRCWPCWLATSPDFRPSASTSG